MAREPRIYPPEKRRFLVDNLCCLTCGNTEAFSIDMRLRHQVKLGPGGLEIGLDKVPTAKLLKALKQNLYKVLDKGIYEDKPRIQCANCGQSESVDMVERVLDTCWNSGCPGCWYCGNFLDEDYVRELCADCIISKDGQVNQEDCEYSCPNSDYGLTEVMAHYGFSLEELKEQLGYSQSVVR